MKSRLKDAKRKSGVRHRSSAKNPAKAGQQLLLNPYFFSIEIKAAAQYCVCCAPCQAFCSSSLFLTAATPVLLAALLRLPRSSSTPFSHHQPSRCPFFACLRVAAGCGKFLLWPPAGGMPCFRCAALRGFAFGKN